MDLRRIAGPFLALLVAIAACAHVPSAERRATPQTDGGTPANETREGAPNSPLPPVPVITTARHGDIDIETACNGIDDDGDGLTDLLLPVGPNACRTGLKGECATGWNACEHGTRVCLAPPPMPEVVDGLDNDCNGMADDSPARHVRPRALVLAPRYAWADAAPDIATVSAVLAQAGIPFDRQPAGTDWDSALRTLERYALAIVPGYLLGSTMTARARQELEQFARRGGVVIVFKPVGTLEQPQAWSLCGLRGGTRRRDVLEVRFDGRSPPPTADIDSPEERTLRINREPAADAVEVWALEPDPAATTQVIARAYAAGAPVGAVITRRPLGEGAIYAVGHDLATFGATRCYVNCFEPSGDVMRLFFEGALREASSGHVVLTHTVPNGAQSALLVTHDIDAPDSHNAGPWGAPGALQAATIERVHHVRATFNITTDFVAGYYNPTTIQELCALEMCPLGAHGVVHPEQFASLPLGSCGETRRPYGKVPTLCGEIRLSMQLVKEATGKTPRVWRSPYLAVHPGQYKMLAEQGIAYDSGFGVGDLPYNLPLDLAAVGFHQNRFNRQPLLEFPVACEDGLVEGDMTKPRRIELQASNSAMFGTRWHYVLLRNAQNRSFTTLLMHPSRGRDMPDSNLRVKMGALDRFLSAAAEADVMAWKVEEMGDFWRARLATSLDASFDQTVYKGTFVTGQLSTAGLTLEFGDEITSFSCKACGEAKVQGKRVILKGMLPRTHADFVARVR